MIVRAGASGVEGRDDIFASSDVRLWVAFIDSAEEGNPDIYNTVLERELAAALGWAGRPGRWLPKDAMERLAVSAEDILGRWDGSPGALRFRPGRAQLTEQEARAYDMWLRGLSLREIAEFLDRKRSRQGGAMPLGTKTAEEYLRRARRRLEEFFGAAEAA